MTEKIEAKLNEALAKNAKFKIKIGGRKLDVYPSSKRNAWTLCWHDGIARQRKVISDESDLKSLVKKIVAAFEQGTKIVENLTAERMREYVEADTTLRGVNLAELVKFYQDHIASQSISVSKARDLFLESRQENSPRHKSSIRLHLEKFCKTFRGTLGAVKATDIDEYLVKNFPNPKTRLNHRVSICSLFAFAQRKGYLAAGLTEAQKTERPKISIVEPCTVSSHSMRNLLNECTNKRVASFLVVSAFAGCRSAETQRLKWKDVRDDGIILGPNITKTGRRRIAEVSDNLRAWVSYLRGEPDDFITYPEEQFYNLYAHLQKLCKQAGVVREQNALRHTFVSCHLELHRDPPRTSKTAGHSLTMLETNYLKLVSREEAEAWFDIFPPENKTYAPVVLRPKKRRKNLIAERNAQVSNNNNNNKREK
jgi:integrase